MFQQWKKLANDMSTTEGSYSSEEEQKFCLTKPRTLLEVLNNSVFNSSNSRSCGLDSNACFCQSQSNNFLERGFTLADEIDASI